jgi:hypothetical protein
MRGIIICLAGAAMCLSAAAGARGSKGSAVYVAPHTTKAGTYVQGSMRTAPNATRLDNYSTKGNTNPYTGSAGTKSPYKPYKP